jgi:lysine/ornithine N-monooxygenase
MDISKGPESITNIQEFGGRIFHSSHWDHEVDFEGKDVVIVGNGASANQLVPWLLKNTGLRAWSKSYEAHNGLPLRIINLVVRHRNGKYFRLMPLLLLRSDIVLPNFAGF